VHPCHRLRQYIFPLSSNPSITLLLLLLLPLLLQSGEPISFYWQFAGIGQERCFHDDVEIPDCASGVIVQVRRMKHHESIQMIASNAVMGTAANQTCEGALEHVVLQGTTL
jgi:hypothetical protein